MQGCSVDRVGKLRIIHVFDEFTARTAGRLVETIRAVSDETDGRIILSILESRDIDRDCVNTAIDELGDIHWRLTLAAAPGIRDYSPLRDHGSGVRYASCFGEVFQ
jgi:hypothetical protein